jgi:hypothetical protein
MGQKVSTKMIVLGGAVAVTTVVLLSKKKTFANRVYMSLEIYDAYCRWRGKPQYYVYVAKGFSLHRGIVIRGFGEDGMPREAFLLHLTLTDGKWEIRCNKTKWCPEEGKTGEYYVAEHEWDLGLAFKICAKFAREFRYYNLLCNNCRSFSEKLLEKMKKGIDDDNLSNMDGHWSVEKMVRLADAAGVDFILQQDRRQRAVMKKQRKRLFNYS